MIITQSPLRITLGGGGTDLPVYYTEHGGQLIVATINKYVIITLHESFNPEHILKYSKYEKVKEIKEIQHQILHEVFKKFNPETYLELSSIADIPAGTGMGSSGAFTCATLLAMHTLHRQVVSKYDLANEACHIEIDLLKEPIGKQDQFASAFGGINEITFNCDGSVLITPLKISSETLMNLQSNLLIFFTGFTRRASQVLKHQQNNVDIIKKLNITKEIGFKSRNALLSGDLDTFGHLMDEHWNTKRSTTKSMSNNEIDRLYGLGINNGALGGKLIGAGGGGFLMFYTNEPKQLRRVMNEMGLVELNFAFENYGSQVVMV